MKIAIGADHAGYTFKEVFIRLLTPTHQVIDLGTSSLDSVDYPDYARLVCQRLLKGEAERGILICGTGIGMSIMANRYAGIRAAVCNFGPEAARLARQHNDANIICLGARLITLDVAQATLEAFLNTSFEGGRHQTRLDKIEALS